MNTVLNELKNEYPSYTASINESVEHAISEKIFTLLEEYADTPPQKAPKKIRKKLSKKQSGRKLLTDYGLVDELFLSTKKDKRNKKWKKQRKKTGIDERNTWSFDTQLHLFLFENLILFIESDNYSDRSVTININGREKTLDQWINTLLHLLHFLLSEWDNMESPVGVQASKYADSILSGIKHSLWW